MPELCDLESGPVAGTQRGDQASHNAGLADVSRMSANNNDCHSYSLRPNLASAAKLFKYSRSGFAGVPQNATPFPRKTFFGRTPA